MRIEAYDVPIDRYYEPEHHFWVALTGTEARIGLDALGQEVSGTIAFVSFLRPGSRVTKGEPFGSIESAKYVGQLVAPVGGELSEINDEVLRDARLLNRDPFGDGWLVVLRGVDPVQLRELVQGEDAIRKYFTDSIRSYRRKGVLAEPTTTSVAGSPL